MQNYSFLNMFVFVQGTPITGWAEGDDVIQVARRENAFNDKVGADGRMIVAQNANQSGSLKFRLQQQSEGNSVLNYLFGLQEGSMGQFAPLQVTVKNIATGELSVGSFGYIVKPAETSRGVNPNAQEWEIVVERLNQLFGSLPFIPV